MNILPKKSWHVRNKDNIERVRRDEEKAAEEEKERLRRVALAESEARTDLLRHRAHVQTSVASDEAPTSTSPKHINFFEDFELGKKLAATNAEHEAEKRQEKERQEKAIGLLTYLGQGSVELDAIKPWYYKPPEKRKSDSEVSAAVKARDEFDAKRKRADDPMKTMDIFVDQSKKVRNLKEGKSADARSHHSRHRSSNDQQRPAASKSIEQLRAERLRREQNERERTRQLMAKLQGNGGGKDAADEQVMMDDRQRRYNSQFNPEIARRPIRRDERDGRF